MAQSLEKKSERMFEKAIALYQHRNYSEAISQIDDLIKINPRLAKAHLLKADIYYDLKMFTEAIDAYNISMKIDSTIYPSTLFILGNLYFETEQYKKAIQSYKHYTTYKSPSITELDKINFNIPLCIFRDSMMQHPVEFNPINLGPNINTKGYEYINAVSLDESQLYFTRRNIDTRNDESFYYSTSSHDDTGEVTWNFATEIGEPINTSGNEGALCVSPDGMTIIITCCSRQDSYGSCDLYISHKQGNIWSEPKNLGPNINTSSWESQPAFAADGKTLYFVSNKPGGYGGSDIYKSSLNDRGFWNQPENLGSNINTAKDEMAPFIHPDGNTLYFSSKGHLGMGSADLFVSRLNSNGQWTKPTNLGYPINTKNDEINLIINTHGNNAYISAERENGEGKTDIYRFTLPPTLRPQYMAYIKGKVFDYKTRQALAAELQVIDMNNNTLIASSHSDKITGEFILCLPVDKDYALNATCNNYLFYSLNFNPENKNNYSDTPPLLVPMKPIEIGEKVVLQNIFFETDKYELLDNSKTELNKLVEFLLSNPSLVIEISGHTDNVGSDSYNILLSQNRSKSVFEYLVSKGINTKQLTYKGYGKTFPIDTNDTPEGRANNRRTEFSVLKKINR